MEGNLSLNGLFLLLWNSQKSSTFRKLFHLEQRGLNLHKDEPSQTMLKKENQIIFEKGASIKPQ